MSIMFLSCGTKFCVSQFFAYFGTLFCVLFQIFMRFVYNQPQKCVKKAAAQGAKIACGSDAGAYRVLHGQGGLDERTLLRRAIGEGADTVTDAGNAVIMARF